MRSLSVFQIPTAVAALAIAFAGCGGGPKGPQLAPVSGVVTLDGQPLPDAHIVFQPSGEKASPSIADTGTDGTFQLAFNRASTGALPGSHTVRITTARIATADDGKETVVEEKLPERYHAKSELKFDVKPEGNRFEIALESKGSARKK